MIRRPPISSLFPANALFFFFFNDTATTEIYTLSLHDALPISTRHRRSIGARRASELEGDDRRDGDAGARERGQRRLRVFGRNEEPDQRRRRWPRSRSEEHTSELQSLTNLVCRLLLEKKKKRQK